MSISPTIGGSKGSHPLRFKPFDDSQNLLSHSLLSGKNESFVRNADIPKLEPMGGHTHSPKKLIYEYINSQKIQLAYEIVPPSCKEPQKKEFQLQLVSEMESYNPQ